MAHLTNFSIKFIHEIFTEDPSLFLLYHGAKTSKMTKNSNQGVLVMYLPPPPPPTGANSKSRVCSSGVGQQCSSCLSQSPRLDVNECLNGADNCQSQLKGGLCKNTFGSFRCYCPPGYFIDVGNSSNEFTEVEKGETPACAGMSKYRSQFSDR